MKGSTEAALVLAALAVACAWWAAAGEEPVKRPEITPVDPDLPAEPFVEAAPPETSPPVPVASPPTDAPVPRAPDAFRRAVEALESIEDDSGAPPGPYRRSHFREMPDWLRTEQREAAWKRLEPLLAKFRAAAPGEERAALLERLMGPARTYMACGGGLELLGLLGESAENGVTRDERARAVIAAHTLWQTEVVDWLVERAKSPHAEVRFYAFEGFAWVVGEERPRAMEHLVRGLEDPEPGIRAVTALSLGSVVGEPAHLPHLVARLGREEDPGVLRTIVHAVLRIDPPEGPARVRAAAPGASGAAWAAVEEELARLSKPK